MKITIAFKRYILKQVTISLFLSRPATVAVNVKVPFTSIFSLRICLYAWQRYA